MKRKSTYIQSNLLTARDIESLNLPIGSHTEVTIDGKSFEVKVYKDTYKEPQRNEDFRVTKEDENVYI